MMDRKKLKKTADRLQAIESQHGGQLRPDDVVEDARDPASPLHEHFEWDDTKAAHAHRLGQARTLIRQIEIEVVQKKRIVKIPYYVRDPDVGNDQGYVSVPRLQTDEDRARRVIEAEIVSVLSALDRAKAIASLLDLEDDVDAVIQQTSALRARARAPTTPPAVASSSP